MNKIHKATLDVGRIIFWALAVFILFGLLTAAGGDVNGFMSTMLDTGNRLASLVVLR